MRFFFFCLQDKNSPSIWHAYHVSKRHTSYFLNAGRRATGEEEEERRGELMRKFSLNLSTVSPYVSPAYCLPHRTFTSVPFFFFLVKTLKYSESFELQRSVCSLFCKESDGGKKKVLLSGWCKCFTLPPLLLLLLFLLTLFWSAASRATLIYSVQSAISALKDNKAAVSLWGFLTFLIKRRINILTVRFIIITNGTSWAQERACLEASVAPIKIHTSQVSVKLLINAEYSDEYIISWCSID